MLLHQLKCSLCDSNGELRKMSSLKPDTSMLAHECISDIKHTLWFANPLTVSGLWEICMLWGCECVWYVQTRWDQACIGSSAFQHLSLACHVWGPLPVRLMQKDCPLYTYLPTLLGYTSTVVFPQPPASSMSTMMVSMTSMFINLQQLQW